MSTLAYALFENRPAAAAMYAVLANEVAALGEHKVEEKKTSLHVVAGRAAFLGVHPRSNGLRLNIVLGRQLEGTRVVKAEKRSAKTYHNEVDLRSEADLDDELRGWLREAYVRVKS